MASIPDVVVVAPGDSGSIKIEAVRTVIDQANYRPFEARRRVVIIDEADALVEQAQHALLKTLEEPPSASIFLLVSSLPDALLPTVRSRCPRLRFGPLTPGEVATVAGARSRLQRGRGPRRRGRRRGQRGARACRLRRRIWSTRARPPRECCTRPRGRPTRRPASGTAQDLSPKKGSPMGERDQLAACLRIMASMLRDLGMIASQADAGVIANADLRADLEALSRAYDARRSVRAYTAVDEALAALETQRQRQGRGQLARPAVVIGDPDGG